MKRNPRKITWTVLYRRKHKKGSAEEVKKKRTRRNVKFQRAVQGATLESILAKRNQTPEVRKALREQAIRLVLFTEIGRWRPEIVPQKKIIKMSRLKGLLDHCLITVFIRLSTQLRKSAHLK